MNQQDRRRFLRIQFDAPAQLQMEGGELESEVIDFSLKGALVRRNEGWNPNNGDEVTLVCDLAQNQQEVIRMETTVQRIGEDTIGLSCKNIDLNSIMRLRRLVELNIGEPALLERDLENLLGD